MSDNFEKIKNECRDEFRNWLEDFDEHYNKYYNYTFFMKINEIKETTIKTINEIDNPIIEISLYSVEEFLDKEKYEEEMFFYNEDIYNNYSLYKKENGCEDCEYRCGKGWLSIEICLQNTNQLIAQIEFYLWSVAYDNSKITSVEEGRCGGLYLSEIYEVDVVNDIFYYKNVKETIINKLKLWIKDFSFDKYFEKQENKIRYYIEESRQCDKWEEESFYIDKHEYYDEYTDNIDSKDDYDLDYDEYDAGYKDD